MPVAGEVETMQGDAPANPVPGQVQAESVARRAYERFEARGGTHGSDQDDWYEAERELNGR